MRKIFIVEDNEAIREFLEIFLSSENYDVRTFSTVVEFRDRDKSITPDLYLFDVFLPDGSGIDLCHQIKQDKDNEGVPVIIMSAHAKMEDMANICQPDDLITKPFDIDNMLERIQAQMN